jgi:hypothetical protein
MTFRTNLQFKNSNYGIACKAKVSETMDETDEKFMTEVSDMKNCQPFAFSLISGSVYFKCPTTDVWIQKTNNRFVPAGMHSYGKNGFYVVGEIVLSTTDGLKKYQLTIHSVNEDLKKKLSKRLRIF